MIPLLRLLGMLPWRLIAQTLKLFVQAIRSLRRLFRRSESTQSSVNEKGNDDGSNAK